MKRIILTAVVIAVAMSSALAQNKTLRNKNGHPILPKKGDWGVGISASPFINTIGNIFKINSPRNFSDQSFFGFTDGQSFFGKYFIEDNKAIRARVDLDFNSASTTALVMKDGQTDVNVTVEDKRKNISSNVALVVGKEFRKGNTRLQGFYGYQGGFGFGTSSTSYTYGNDYSTSSPNPTMKNWGNNLPSASRILKAKNGGTFSVMAGAFVGAEYFVMPKVSLGGELSWILRYSNTGKGFTDSQKWDGTNSKIEHLMKETGGSSNFGANNYGGRLYFMFYF